MILVINYVSTIVFFLICGLGFFLVAPLFYVYNIFAMLIYGVLVVLAMFIASAIKIAAQWEKAVILRLGKYIGTKGPGLFFIIPLIDEASFVDTRVLTMDIPKQQVITKDNVPCSINGVLYFMVESPDHAIITVQNYKYAMSQYAQAALRDVVGGVNFDDLLSERKKIGKEIEEIVESEARSWGLKVTQIRIMDVDIPEDLKKMMSRQASAEREKRANITKAEGDKLAAINLAAAAQTMLESPGAMQLRTLQTLDGLGNASSNTVVVGIPVELYDLVKNFSKERGNGKVSTH